MSSTLLGNITYKKKYTSSAQGKKIGKGERGRETKNEGGKKVGG